MAGNEGFEPPNARTKIWCLTTWRIPIIFTCFISVKARAFYGGNLKNQVLFFGNILIVIEMDKNKKNLKILLRGGDKKNEIFLIMNDDYLSAYDKAYLLIPDDFPLLLLHEFVEFFQEKKVLIK